MKCPRSAWSLVVLVMALPGFAADNKADNAPAPTKNVLPASLQGHGPLTKQTRLQLIRSMEAEFGFAKALFPKGEKGLQLTSSGQLSPDEQAVTMQVATFGPAARPGDKVEITDIKFKGSEIVFEINGGSKKKGHWYDHVEVGGNGGFTPIHQEKGAAAKGCTLDLVFPKYVPEMTANDVKQLLSPVIDFSVKSPTQAYLDTLPPKLKSAIENHEVLVGMSKDMVTDALGRPPKRDRETDAKNIEYEEWIYGEPPGEVKFIRFENEEVVRVERAQIGDKPEILTARQVKVNPVTGRATMIDPNAPQTASVETADANATQTAQVHKPPKAPTMLRPGEKKEDTTAGQPVASAPGELGSKPVPPSGQNQEPEWGTKPATPTAAPPTIGAPSNPAPPQDPNATGFPH
ncbi:MAG TPA: hypothetical protein VFQ00_08840 [Terriglobales bacterium]|nr:hypothetical protein [Terriglobales bacterium]